MTDKYKFFWAYGAMLAENSYLRGKEGTAGRSVACVRVTQEESPGSTGQSAS